MRSLASKLVVFLTLLFIGCVVSDRFALAQQGTMSVTVHVVQQGETLSDIAQQYNITTDALIDANGLSSSVDIVVGQRLIIPEREPLNAASSMTLGAGDSLYAISVREGVNLNLLASFNRIMNPEQIFIGEALSIPGPTMSATDDIEVVRLKPHESIWQMALRRNMNFSALMDINSIENPLVIAPGSVIAVNADENAESVLMQPWDSIRLHPAPLDIGRSAALEISTTTPGEISATFLDKPVHFTTNGNHYLALLGVYRWTDAGLYPLAITFTGTDGSVASYARLVRINEGGYAAEIIKLSEEDAAVYADTTTVQQEADTIAGLMSGFSSDRLWDGLFRLPTSGVMSSAFGTARSYDSGATYSVFHAGSDFFAKAGTPIYAPTNGVVVATGQGLVRGNYTIIDHGWGVYSGFWHQSNILVATGDQVVIGQMIGEIGTTGLSTANHLHWEMWVGGVQVDPLQWAREVFP